MSQTIILPSDDEISGGRQGFGRVVKHLGAAIFLLEKSDGRTVKAKQRGGMSRSKKGKRVSKKIMIDDWVLFSERGLGGNIEADILYKYTESEVKWLQLNDYIRVWEDKSCIQSSNVVFVESVPQKKKSKIRKGDAIIR